MCSFRASRLLLLLLAAAWLCATPVARADSCNSPPQGFGGAWAQRYRSWCEGCCGTYSSSGPSCDPGSNWGCGSSGGSAAGGGGGVDVLQRFQETLFQAAQDTNRVVNQGAAASKAAAQQVNAAQQRSSQSVDAIRQRIESEKAREKARRAEALSSELAGLPLGLVQPAPEVVIRGDAVRIRGDTPKLMGGDPIAECRRPPAERRWDLDCPRILRVASFGDPAEVARLLRNDARLSELLGGARQPADGLGGMRARLAEYLYGEASGKAREKGEEYLNSLGANGRAAVRAAKTRDILQNYAKETLSAAFGQAEATVCFLGTDDPGCMEAFHRDLRRQNKATGDFQKESRGFIAGELGLGDANKTFDDFLAVFR